MSANNDGGPAFPHHETTSTGEPYYDHLGMSLRDWFAGQALIALPHIGCGCDLNSEDLAYSAYQLADAMLAAKETRK